MSVANAANSSGFGSGLPWGRKKEPIMAKNIIKEIRRAPRRKFSAEEKIRIVLEGLRGESPISELT